MTYTKTTKKNKKKKKGTTTRNCFRNTQQQQQQNDYTFRYIFEQITKIAKRRKEWRRIESEDEAKKQNEYVLRAAKEKKS